MMLLGSLSIGSSYEIANPNLDLTRDNEKATHLEDRIENSVSERETDLDQDHEFAEETIGTPNIQEVNDHVSRESFRLEDRYDKVVSTGSIEVQALGDGVGITTEVEIWSVDGISPVSLVSFGETDNNGIFKADLQSGRYIAKVHGAVTQTSDILDVQIGKTSKYTAEFVSLELSPYSIGTPRDSATIHIESDVADVYKTSVSIEPDRNEVLWVVPGTYSFNGLNKQTDIKVHGFETVPIEISLDNVAFGELVIYSNTSDDMPISASYRVYNSTSGDQVTSGSLGSDGVVSMNLAPGDYDVETYVSDATNRIKNNSVTIIGEQTTSVYTTFSQFIVYTNTSSWIYVYDEMDTNVASGHRGTSEGNEVFYLPAGIAYDFTVSSEGTTFYNRNSTLGEKVILGVVVQAAPYFTSFPTSTSKVLADETTTITANVFDPNYDYPLTLNRVVNYGSTVVISSGWVSKDVFQFQINYTAPSFDETYRLDLDVIDPTNLFSNFTMYLSNRQATVNLNSTGYNDRPIGQWIYAYDAYTGINQGSAHSGSTGETSMNLYDGEYYFVWTSTINYVSPVYSINASNAPYSIHYQWAEVNINVTGNYGESIGGTARIYNASDLGTTLTTLSVSSSTGSTLAIIPSGDYSIKTYASTESSSVWKFDVMLNATERPSLVFQFGVLTVYQFDENSNPEAVWTYLYNATASLTSSISSGHTGSDGIALYILAPYGNYSLKSSRSTTEWYHDLVITAEGVTVIGNFTNSAPVISDITASPRRIGPNENTTVTVTVSDIDPIDQLTYTWSVSEGTISGSGNEIIFFAPSVGGVYQIDVNVTDNYGGWANTTIWVSSRTSDITVNTTQGAGNPYAVWVYAYDGITGDFVGSDHTGSDGIGLISSLYDGPYEIRVTANNLWAQQIFVADGSYIVNFNFASVTMNATSVGGQGISTTIKVYSNSTGGTEASSSTSSSTGLNTLLLRPDVYNFESTVSGTSITYQGITIVADSVSTYDFKFGRISVNVTSGYGKPISMWTYLYQYSSSSISSSYASYGITYYDVAPGNYNLSFSSTPTYLQNNIAVVASSESPAVLQLGVLAVYTNNGSVPISQSIKVYSSGTFIYSATSGADGIDLRDLVPGTYDVLIDDTTWHYNVVITGGQRTQVGTRLNANPVIVSVNSIDTGPSTTQTVTVTLTDDDFDYEYLYLDLYANVGTLSAIGAFHGFTSTGDFQITFDYTSPSTTGVYRVNITVHDSFGGNDTYTIYLSNNVNPVHLYSFIDNLTPRDTFVYIYDSLTGATVYSGNLGIDGYRQFDVVDGLYDIRFKEDNSIWIYQVEIAYGGYYNFSAYFGVVEIYVTTTGGNPVSTWTYAYDHPKGTSSIASKHTGSDGIATYILAPGTYEFDIVQTNTITIVEEVEGGFKSIIGNDVPQLVNPPEDLTYTYGDTGNVISWEFIESTPHYYNITMDGVTISHGLWNGSIISINVDGLYPGTYWFTIYVNDTNGLPNQDTVIVTVLPSDEPLINPHGDISVEVTSTIGVSWVINGANSDKYIVYLDGAVFENGVWVPGFVNITLTNLGVGSYNLTLFINDTLGQISVDYFILTIVDSTAPTLVHSGNLTYVAGQTNNIITFTPYDNYSPGTYNVTIDGTTGSNLVWGNGTTYQINVDGLSVGLHTIIIKLTDSYSNSISAIIEVTVLDPAVTLVASPSSETYEAPADIGLTWTFQALEISNYTIFVNGSEVESSTMPANGSVTYSMEALDPAIYNVTILVVSTYGTSLADFVEITVEDTTSPTFVNVPSNMQYTIGTTGHFLVWEISDVYLSSFEIYINGTLTAHGSFNGNIANISIDGLVTGNHTVMIKAYDLYGNSATDEIMVTVLGIASRVLKIINTPQSMLVDESVVQIDLAWEVNSTNPDTYAIIVNGSQEVNATFSTGTINFSFVHSGPALYKIILRIADVNGTTVTDSVFILVLQGATNTTSTQSTPLNLPFVVMSFFAMATLLIVKRKEVKV